MTLSATAPVTANAADDDLCVRGTERLGMGITVVNGWKET